MITCTPRLSTQTHRLVNVHGARACTATRLTPAVAPNSVAASSLHSSLYGIYENKKTIRGYFPELYMADGYRGPFGSCVVMVILSADF